MEVGPEASAAVPTTEGEGGTRNLSEPSRVEGSEEARAVADADDEEAAVSRAQRLIDKILETKANPNPRHIHALAMILEAQEAKYLQESTHPSFDNARASHTIGRLGNLARDNDEFYESISSKFLTESGYSVSVRAASARLLLSTSSSWMYPHVFDDAVLDNIKIWVAGDGVVSDNECIWKHELGANKPMDTELLRTYATGLLALSLAGGGQVVEDSLTSGLSAKLMHYLRIRLLGYTSNQNITFPAEIKHSSLKSREENIFRTCQVLDTTRLKGSNVGEEGLLHNPSVCQESDRNIVSMQVHGDDYWGGSDSLKSESTVSSSKAVGIYETVDENAVVADDGWQNRNLLDDKYKHGESLIAAKSTRDDDADESLRDELYKQRVNRGLPRSKLKVRTDETVESERTLTSPSRLRLGSNSPDPRDKIDDKRMINSKTNSSRVDYDSLFNRDDHDEHMDDCIIGSSDVSEMVKKAIKAAEAEARAAGAPLEAIKAAGDAAAELVKSAAMEAWKSTNDEAAVVLAASKTASTVVDAAIATEVSKNAKEASEDLVQLNSFEVKSVEQMEDFIILDAEHLSNLRVKYCIQCLENLGEYIEALGPILHEKGVDVCLALLHENINDERAPGYMTLLPEVLKLICALAAHRKFAALFVDCGGMQKLLSVRRVQQTFFGLSSCLFTIGSLQGIMERVCALPSDVVNQIVELALQLLECSQEQARKNAAIFFAAAFVFRAVLDSFDSQEGLHQMLGLLRGAASVRSGGNSGSLGAPNSSLRNDRSAPDVLTASEKQIAYHTCVALRQYFRAHLLLLVESLRPNKSSRTIARNAPSARPAYKPLDISNEAMDTLFIQIQRDRKIGSAFVRACSPAVDKFLASNGHITMLELCQATPVDRYLHDLAQHALGIIQLVTFVPYSHRLIVNATLTNNRIGMAVILDAASGAGYAGPEVIHPALNVLVNLVCPPPSISNKPSSVTHGQQTVPVRTLTVSSENRERHPERNVSGVPLSFRNELRERNVESHSVERCSVTAASAATSSNPQTPTSSMSAGVVGDRRISLGPGAGSAGLAAQLEQGYHQAREAVRANNGIKVILHLLHPRMITPPAALDCIRALACRVLLGLARDGAIAHILTKLQVGKKLSELIRDSGSQASGTEQGRWQSELAQVAIELIAVVTNSGRASTLATTDAAAPTLRRIERAAIAAATPITYHSRELLQLIHEHLQASGFMATAALLQKEADLTPLPSSGLPFPALHQTPVHESSSVQLHWPSGRVSNLTKTTTRDEDNGGKSDFTPRKKLQASSSSFSRRKCQLPCSSTIEQSNTIKIPRAHGTEIVSPSGRKSISELRTPILLPMRRKFMELKEPSSTSASKRVATAELAFQSPVSQVPISGRRHLFSLDPAGVTPIIKSSTRDTYSRTLLNNLPRDNSDDVNCIGTPGFSAVSQPGMPADLQLGNNGRMTLDSLVVQYLKHQHRQCPAPITTLPPLSLMHPHVCPEPSRALNAPANVTARIGTRDFRKQYGGIHAHRRDRQFIYSRFKPCRSCRDDTVLLSCITFLEDSSTIATGGHSGELKIFDANNGNILESHLCHQTPVTIVKSAFSGGNQLLVSSGSYDVKLWDASSISIGPLHSFEACKSAHFSHSGANFAALSTDISRREVLLYDVQTCSVELRLPDSSNGAGTVRGHMPSLIHFNPSDTMILWNGILWDRRNVNAVHRFDQFTDYGGGGFHPSGNEVIINSEVWDIRKLKLLRTVPSLDQTVITFNGSGDIIYAILRRNIEDITSAVNTRRVRHPLFSAFRTIDAINYSDIATVQVDRCVLDFARDPADSLVGVIAMDDHEEMFSSARLYEVGRKRPTDDDSDLDDDGESSDESDEDDDENDETDADVGPIWGVHFDGDDRDFEHINTRHDDVDSVDELNEDGDFNIEDFDGDQGFLDMIAEADEEDEDTDTSESLSSEDE